MRVGNRKTYFVMIKCQCGFITKHEKVKKAEQTVKCKRCGEKHKV